MKSFFLPLRSWTVLLMLLWLTPWVVAQNGPIQALKQQIQQTDSEEAKIPLLLDLSKKLIRNHPEEAYQYALEAESLAITYNDLNSRAEARLCIGNSRWMQAFYQKAYSNYRSALEQFGMIDDSLGMANAWHNIARVEWRLGNYPEAMSSELEAIHIRENYTDSAGISESYFWMGILKADLFEYEHARKYYYQAFDIASALKDLQMMADILNYVGRSWRKQNIFDKAMAAHYRSLALYEMLGDTLGISDYHNNVGSIYRRQGKYTEALHHFFKAIPIQQKLNDQEGLADGYNDIGTTYSQMGQFRRAILWLEKGLEISKNTGLTDDIRYAYSSLAATYDSLGEYQQAYKYHQLLASIKDTLLDQAKNNQIAHLDIRYESQKKSQMIDNLELKSQRNQLIGLLLAGALLVLLLFGGFMLYRSRIQSRLNRELERKNTLIELEKQRSEELLLNILPEEIADELRYMGRAKARSYEQVTVLFSDFKGFTLIAEKLTPRELVAELHYCFEAFDKILAKYKVEKIKTIGDAYMCAGGLPIEDPNHAIHVVQAGLEMQAFMAQYRSQKETKGEPWFEARIGIHSGPVVAGIVGIHKFSFDIWGDTVNMAARMESCGEVGKVNISHDTYLLIQQQFICRHRGKVHAKHKGEVDMYFVEWEKSVVDG